MQHIIIFRSSPIFLKTTYDLFLITVSAYSLMTCLQQAFISGGTCGSYIQVFFLNAALLRYLTPTNTLTRTGHGAAADHIKSKDIQILHKTFQKGSEHDIVILTGA